MSRYKSQKFVTARQMTILVKDPPRVCSGIYSDTKTRLGVSIQNGVSAYRSHFFRLQP